MLVLSRKESEKIRLGEDVILTIVRVSGDRRSTWDTSTLEHVDIERGTQPRSRQGKKRKISRGIKVTNRIAGHFTTPLSGNERPASGNQHFVSPQQTTFLLNLASLFCNPTDTD